MKIAYRRMSGAIGTSQLETGTRGLWFEKRGALYRALVTRGHTVDYVNRMTRYSQQLEEPKFDARTHDLLMVEFGSNNERFNGKDLDRTREMVDQHAGPIVFICDDPDLPYLWKTVGDGTKWSMWMNATRPQPFGGCPPSVRCYDAPFAALLPDPKPVSHEHTDRLVYMGRALGRKSTMKKILEAQLPLDIFSNPKDWKDYPVQVHEPPTQVERSNFYGTKLGCLVLADNKHKELGWRTGRAYHALYAGCPSVVEADHPALIEGGFVAFRDVEGLLQVAARWKSDEGARVDAWKSALPSVHQDRARMQKLFREFDL
jgi:hypothetical protein